MQLIHSLTFHFILVHYKMVTDIEIYCEALKVLKFLVTSTVNNLAVIEINNSTNKHEQNDRKSRIEKPPLINEPSISLILSNMQSLTKKVNSCYCTKLLR